MTESSPNPEIIKKLEMAVHPSFALLAGMQLDLFTPLKDGPMSCEDIASATGVDCAKLKPLLYALVCSGLLRVEGELFSNGEEAHTFLVRDSPSYMGGSHELWSSLWNAELRTAESIRTGRPQAKYDYSSMPRDELTSALRGMHPSGLKIARDWAERYDFSNCRELLDVGGGSGAISIGLTELCPQVRATVVDLPSVVPVTRLFIDEAGASDRVSVVQADVVHDPLNGSFDVAILSALLQVLHPGEARAVVKNVGRAVKPGGRIFIRGYGILDDCRTSPIHAVAFNLVFINLYDGGQAYTEREHREWLIEAGFEKIKRDTLPDGHDVFIAVKGDDGHPRTGSI